MKLNITIGGKDILSGYLNIDPTHEPPQVKILTKSNIKDNIANDNILKADIRNLDKHVEDAECKEIIINHVCDFLEMQDALDAIRHWTGKLRHEGVITLMGSDAYEICKSFLNGELNILEFNKKMHGEFSSPWDVKMSHFTMESACEALAALGLEISQKKINKYSYIVKAVRP